METFVRNIGKIQLIWDGRETINVDDDLITWIELRGVLMNLCVLTSDDVERWWELEL